MPEPPRAADAGSVYRAARADAARIFNPPYHLIQFGRTSDWSHAPACLNVMQSAALPWSLDISGLVACGVAPAQAYRGAPKAPIITAQPSGLGTRTADAKALKARSIGLAIEAWVNGLLAARGTSILRSTISEIELRRWRLRLLLAPLPGALPGRCPRLVWAGCLARVIPRRGMDHASARGKS